MNMLASKRRMRRETHVERALALVRSVPGHTVRGVLLDLGLDRAWVLRYESAAGRACAQAYRAAEGRDPAAVTAVVVRGRVRPAFAYDGLLELLTCLLTYKTLRKELGI